MSEQDPRLTIPTSRSVLLFNDMINSNLRSSPERVQQIDASGMIPASVQMVAHARSVGIPVFWIRVERRADRADVAEVVTDVSLASAPGSHAAPLTKGAPGGANIMELPIDPADQVILKPRFDPFIGTDLDLQLRARGITHILLGGYSTNMGVESCARTARDLGYNVVVLRDCCYNVEADLHEWTLTNIMPRIARVLTSDETIGYLG